MQPVTGFQVASVHSISRPAPSRPSTLFTPERSGNIPHLGRVRQSRANAGFNGLSRSQYSDSMTRARRLVQPASPLPTKHPPARPIRARHPYSDAGRLRRFAPDLARGAVSVCFWRDIGYAVGALVERVIGDLFGLTWAIVGIGTLTFVSGAVVVFVMPAKTR